MADSSKYSELAATILQIGVSIGLLLFALQLLYGAPIETAVLRSFLVSSAVSTVIVVVRAVFIQAQAAALRASAKKIVSEPKATEKPTSDAKRADNEPSKRSDKSRLAA